MRVVFGLFLFICLAFTQIASAQQTFMYRLLLKDKGSSPFSVEQPEAFLSSQSVERRAKQGYVVDESDLPLDSAYLSRIRETGAKIRTCSKWLATVVVHLTDTTTMLPALRRLDFIDSLTCVWSGNLPSPEEFAAAEITRWKGDEDSGLNSYGESLTQITLNNGHLLHDRGFKGSGISIAVIDAGFANADRIAFFDQDRIRGVKNFNHETIDPFRDATEHGTQVLSCLLANRAGELVGSAPEADYYLLRTEVASEEYPVEEDYWVAALEYADSIGVDIVTTSLGYTTFDDKTMDHNQWELDGKTVPASRAAGMAASKGLLLFNSAGNEGNKWWGKITVPSDAENIITVGSVTESRECSPFSSRGFTADGRVKPDLMAMGSQVSLLNGQGTVMKGYGTSYATPLLAGMAACLWGALPALTNLELMQILRETAGNYQTPDSLMGYGTADMERAYLRGSELSGLSKVPQPPLFRIDRVGTRLYVNCNGDNGDILYLTIYSLPGNVLIRKSHPVEAIDISPLRPGVYLIEIRLEQSRFVGKFIR